MTPEQQKALALAKARRRRKEAEAAGTASAPTAAPTGNQAVPAMAMPLNAELQTQGPGPTGMIAPELYDKGILPRRYVEGMQKAPGARIIRDERTGTDMPEYVTTGTGERAYYNPETSTYSTEAMMAEDMKPGAGKAFQAGAASGVTMGWGDDLMGAALGQRTGARIRAMTEASRRDRPGMTLAGEVSGALSLPIPVKGGATVKEAAKAGAKVGSVLGLIYGAGTADGGVVEKVKGGLEGAVSGAIFGAATPVAINYGSKAFQKLFGRSAARPTLESLKATKKAAYGAVDSSGEKFTPYDIGVLAEKAKAGMDDINYLPEVDDQTAAMLKRLDALSTREMTIGQVDKLRQDLWDRYNKSGELGLMEIIDGIDEMITARTSTSELMDAARVANARYKKAELLDLAFQKAADQTAATGSGGNVLNKMRQAVTAIINNPKQAKWFAPAEIETMRAFVHGSTSENVLRQIGKLAPTGNGLMTALNLISGATFGAPALAVSGVASGAKAIADRSTEKGAQRLIGMVAGQPAAAPAASGVAGTPFVRAAGPVGNALMPR